MSCSAPDEHRKLSKVFFKAKTDNLFSINFSPSEFCNESLLYAVRVCSQILLGDMNVELNVSSEIKLARTI